MIRDIDQLRAHLQESADRRELREVAAATGVPYGTVRSILKQTASSPRLDNFARLADFYARRRRSH